MHSKHIKKCKRKSHSLPIVQFWSHEIRWNLVVKSRSKIFLYDPHTTCWTYILFHFTIVLFWDLFNNSPLNLSVRRRNRLNDDANDEQKMNGNYQASMGKRCRCKMQKCQSLTKSFSLLPSDLPHFTLKKFTVSIPFFGLDRFKIYYPSKICF